MTLKEWMDLTGLTDAQLAARVVAETGEAISRSQVNRIKYGDSTPRPKTARALEVVTKIPAAAFVMGAAASPREKRGEPGRAAA